MTPKPATITERVDRWIYVWSPLFMPIACGLAAIAIAVVLIMKGRGR